MRGGGFLQHAQQPLNVRAVPIQIWSSDGDLGSKAGFKCVHDALRRVLYAKLTTAGEEPDERLTKVAINTLLDMAEASNSKKITIGLNPEHAGCATIVCSLLYLGFQVVPSRKSPLKNIAIMLDFHTGWNSSQGGFYSSDQTFTGTSDCSTSADENLELDTDSD